MPDPGKPDRWNSLLETLGVPATQPPPEAEKPAESAAEATPARPPKTISALPPPKSKPAPKPKPAPPQAKSPSYWSRIAGALGLEVPPEPEPTIEPPRVEPPRRVEPARAESPPEEAFRRPPPAAPPVTPPRDTERARDAREPEPGPLDDLFGEPTPDVDVFHLKGDEPERPPLEEDQPPRPRGHERPRGRDFEPRRGREPRRRRDEQPQRGPVLEYGIEGDDLLLGGEETTAEPSEPYGERPPESAEDRPRRRRRRGRGRGRRGREEEGREEGREAGREEGREEGRREVRPRRDEPAPAAEGAYYDLDRDEELDSDLESLSEVAREEDDDLFPPAEAVPRHRDEGPRGERPRRGRRRRRDREEGPEERTVAREPAYEEEETARRPAGRPPRHEKPAERERLEDDSETDELDEEAIGHPAHKKIPTWQEAIGILVEANMATRASSPERERGRGRGRGRR